MILFLDVYLHRNGCRTIPYVLPIHPLEECVRGYIVNTLIPPHSVLCFSTEGQDHSLCCVRDRHLYGKHQHLAPFHHLRNKDIEIQKDNIIPFAVFVIGISTGNTNISRHFITCEIKI